MYNKFLSRQWIFDRCIEFSHPISLILLFLFVLFLGYLTYKGFKSLNRHAKISSVIIKLAAVVTTLIYLVVLGFSALVFALFFCTAHGSFWLGIFPADGFSTHLRWKYLGNEKMPQNQTELRELDPANYELMLKNAKVNYVYDPDSRSYTLFVRPSKYHMVVFDNKHDKQNYNLSSIFGYFKFQKYPPAYDGPWDKLPK